MKFEIGQVAPMVKFIAALTWKPHRNVDVPLAVLRPNLDRNKKRAEADVIGSLGLVGDFDDADAKNWRTRLPVEAHLALETSRGWFQPFLLFDKPYPPREAKPIAVRLKSFCHCDHVTADISHVWRVPETLNWPNKKKFDEGRVREPQPVRVVKQLNGQCGLTLDDLAAALPLDPMTEPERKTKQKRKWAAGNRRLDRAGYGIAAGKTVQTNHRTGIR